MFSKMFKKKNRLGFSLIEMLVVIAIVAILVSIIVPTITRATLKSAAATNAANLRAIEGQIGTLRVMNADKFEDLDYQEWQSNVTEENNGWASLENLFGVYGEDVATYTANENGVLTIGEGSDAIVVENVPGAKAMTVTAKDGRTRDIAEDTCMTVYITQTGIAATYNSVSRDNFADIAEDGTFDGEMEKTSDEKKEEAWEDFEEEVKEEITETVDKITECVTPDTMITLADGTKVRVDALNGDEELLVWNMETGMLDSAPIMFVDSEPEAVKEVINLHFSDGSVVKVISEHGFWDYTLNKYVYLDRNASLYAGHSFFKLSENGGEKVELVEVVLTEEVTTAWSPVTVGHLCYFVNDMLSMPGGVGGLFNIFEVDPETMTYDYEAMERDLTMYGVLTYEELSAVADLSEEMFNAAGGAYLKVSMGKGNLTEEELFAMIDRYGKFFE